MAQACADAAGGAIRGRLRPGRAAYGCAIPPVMVHAGSASDLIGQIRSQGPVTGREDVRALHGELGGGLQLKQ